MATQLKVTKKMLKKKVRITPYAIICGIILLGYTVVLLYPMTFGLINSMKAMYQFYEDPVGLPDFSWFQLEDFRYQLNDGTYLKTIFANYLIVLEELDYINSTVYYSGISTKVEVIGGFDSNYLQMSGYVLFLIFLWNTIWTTVAGTVVPVFWCAALGYVCAKYRYKFVGFIYGIVIFRISCPIIGGGSSMLAMQRAVENLEIKADYAMIDGNRIPQLEIDSECIVKGDAKSMSIACASILAKVSRDRLLYEYAKEYPEYQFEKHKGYGTKLHRELLKEFGPCPYHRMSFLKKIL
jgi:ABC-type glycerol-3-phosphate transport system permease component